MFSPINIFQMSNLEYHLGDIRYDILGMTFSNKQHFQINAILLFGCDRTESSKNGLVSSKVDNWIWLFIILFKIGFLFSMPPRFKENRRFDFMVNTNFVV